MTLYVEAAVQVSLLLSAGLLAHRLSTDRSAAFRHFVLAGTILCSLATPLVAAVVPQWPQPLRWPPVSSPAVHPVSTDRSTATIDNGPASTAAVVVNADATAPPSPFSGTARIVTALWLAGALATLLPLARGFARLRGLARRSRPLTDGPWATLAERERVRLGLPTRVRLLHSRHPSLLVTWGWWRPHILVPDGATAWSETRIRMVLAHELAHVSRGDWAVQLSAELLRVLHWFNPLVWLAAARLRLDSEYACDDHVLAQGIAAPDYADELLALARSLTSSRHPSVPAPAMARPSSLEGRVHAMLHPTHDRRLVSRRARVAITTALAVATMLVAGLRAQAPLVPVSGTAYDATGRVLPNVRVVLTHPADQSRFEVLTDRGGRYLFAAVPAGTYTLEARLTGFADLSDSVEIAAGTSRDLLMRVGTLRETITVRTAPAGDAADLPPLAERRDAARRHFAELADAAAAKCKGGVASTAVGGNIFVPRKLVHVAARYPDELRATNTGGTVTLLAVIGTDGAVRDIRHVEAPHPALAAAAEDAVRQWQFSTTYLNCEPIEVQMTVTTNFVSR